jgi:hypothetical protein
MLRLRQPSCAVTRLPVMMRAQQALQSVLRFRGLGFVGKTSERRDIMIIIRYIVYETSLDAAIYDLAHLAV